MDTTGNDKSDAFNFSLTIVRYEIYRYNYCRMLFVTGLQVAAENPIDAATRW